MKVKTQLRFFGYGHKSFTTQTKEALPPIGPPFACFSENTEDGLVDGYFSRVSIYCRTGLKEAPSGTSYMSRHKYVSNNSNTAPDRKTIGKTLIFDFENP